MAGVVDRQNRISLDAIGNGLSSGERFGIGGVGDMDVVQDVAAFVFVFCPSGVEGEETEVASGDEGDAIVAFRFQVLDDRDL